MLAAVCRRAGAPLVRRFDSSLRNVSFLALYGVKKSGKVFQTDCFGGTMQVRRFASASEPMSKGREMIATTSVKSIVDNSSSWKYGHPDYSPIPVLSKEQISQITTGTVGSKNLNITERDLLELDTLAQKLSSMLEEPFDEGILMNLKDYNVDKLFNRVKGTLHVDDVPATIKAIRVLSAQNRVEDALTLWNILKQNPHHCTLFAWTAYLNTLCTHNKSTLARQELKEMVLSGVSPDQHIYGVLVNGLVLEGKLNEAFSVTREMSESGLRPNNIIFSSLIYGCIKKRQLARANETFDLMRNYIEEPDSISIALMIKVSELQHNTERAIRFFDSLDVHQQLVTQGCYHAIMHACARSWRYDVMAFDYFQKMEVAGIAPSLSSYHILLEACAQRGDFVRANSVMVQLQERGFKPTSETLSLLLMVLGNASGNGLALPEHPAGNRRYTREEYEMYLKGLPVAIKRDRLAYVRDSRRKAIDDGLGETEEEETSGGMYEAEGNERSGEEEMGEESNSKNSINPLNPLSQLEETDLKSIEASKAELLQNAKQALQRATPKSGLSQGLSQTEIDAEINRIEGKSGAPQVQNPIDEIVKRTEELVAEKFSVQPMNATDASVAASNREIVDKALKEMNERGLISRNANMDLLRSREESIVELMQLEEKGRSLLVEAYKAKGGDEKHIDYASPLWKSCVDDVLNRDVCFVLFEFIHSHLSSRAFKIW